MPLQKIDLRGLSLTTVRIRYCFPDHPTLLAPPFVWQFEDVPPEFPRVYGFLDYWKREIIAPLKSVIVMHSLLVKPYEILNIDSEWKIH